MAKECHSQFFSNWFCLISRKATAGHKSLCLFTKSFMYVRTFCKKFRNDKNATRGKVEGSSHGWVDDLMILVNHDWWGVISVYILRDLFAKIAIWPRVNLDRPYCSNVSYFGIISFAVFMDFKWDVDELHDFKIFHILLKYDSVENLNMRRILSNGITVVFDNLAKFWRSK